MMRIMIFKDGSGMKSSSYDDKNYDDSDGGVGLVNMPYSN